VTLSIALVTGGFSIVVAMIGYLAHTNRKDHAENGTKLDFIADLLRDHLKGHK
jgi:hypothetical protein